MVFRTHVSIGGAGKQVRDRGMRTETGNGANVGRAFVAVVGARLSGLRQVNTLAGNAGVISAFVAVVRARRGVSNGRMGTGTGDADVIRAYRSFVRTGITVRDGRVTVSVGTADIFGAFVAIVRAGATGNDDVGACAIDAQVIRAGVAIIGTNVRQRVGRMEAGYSATEIECADVAVVGTKSGDI